MSIKAFDAASAYGAALGRAPAIGGSDDGAVSIGSSAPAAGGGFGAMVSNMMQEGVAATKQAEVASAGAVTRTSDLVSVATAVNSAEITLETIVAVRDRMISAYQDIIRMPI
jgi:flagellar hook-basal body complex protein FliE